MKSFLGWIGAFVFLLTVSNAYAEMWKYEDGSGAVNFTDDYNKIPLEFRHTAKQHVAQAPTEAQANASNGDIMARRKEIISKFTPEQAKEAVQKGMLTVEEVNFLVEVGALRASDVGDAYRFAGKPEPKAAPAPGAPAGAEGIPAELLDRDTKMLQELAQQSKGGGSQVGAAKDLMTKLKDSPKAKYSMIGQGIFVLVLIIAYPMVLRKYNDDSTRRIIRMSFMMIFVIVSSTGHMVLWKDEVAELLGFKRKVTSGAAAPAQMQAPKDMPAKRPWDNNRF